MQFPPISRHFISLRSKYSPQHPVLKHVKQKKENRLRIGYCCTQPIRTPPPPTTFCEPLTKCDTVYTGVLFCRWYAQHTSPSLTCLKGSNIMFTVLPEFLHYAHFVGNRSGLTPIYTYAPHYVTPQAAADISHTAVPTVMLCGICNYCFLNWTAVKDFKIVENEDTFVIFYPGGCKCED
jgi:hypothetical protein